MLHLQFYIQSLEFIMHTETISYRHGQLELRGHLVYNNKIETARPAVIVAHAWKGQDEFARNKARALAELGYIAFAVDIYGEGKEVETSDEAAALMMPLFLDRQLLQERMKAAYDVVSNHPMVNAKMIGGIGFCFGGLAIIELFRSGVDLRGVVSFHAVLGDEMGENKAKIVPIAQGIKGSLLMLHGYDDPLVSAKDIETKEQEFTQANVDWQLHVYGHTSHAFTVPGANDKSLGLIYNPKANQRSWKAMRNFFDEVFI